ncbi:conserved hypothetical protein [Ricinus communis]|uniref:Uncharacterized protein n=1 Tax=Ricinus communis TaxID=3988 RepID=B9TEA5_RICCO|nr:conserved hypothetical protein [Ricinus communis]
MSGQRPVVSMLDEQGNSARGAFVCARWRRARKSQRVEIGSQKGNEDASVPI